MTANGRVSPGDLFVFYGLLKQGAEGMPAHIDLERAGAFLGPAWLRGTLYDFGGFPGVVAGEGLVEGVRYRMDDTSIVAALDEFEDVIEDDPASSLYVRRRVGLLNQAGGDAGETAWVYWYNQPTAGYLRIESGIWPLSAGRPRT